MTDLLLASAVDASLRITALAATIALLLALFRIRSSTTRHAAWSTVAVTMLLMPLLTRVAPEIRVPVPTSVSSIPSVAPAAFYPPGAPQANPSSTFQAEGREAQPATTRTAVAVESTAKAARTTTPTRWSTVALALYVTGVLVLLVRFLAGLVHLGRIRRNASCVEPGILESPLVATPVTVGIFAPHVVLPRGWRAWPTDTLTAVLAHERAHAARHDPLIAVLTRLNCVVFWFHPLAWWLERKVATLAEHVCDDAALQQVAPRRYAETLLDIAGTVRQRNGRVVWQGVGVDGNGRLGRRIDRVLAGASAPEPSTVRRLLTGTSCTIAIVAAIACQQEQKVEPLRENPELAANLRSEREAQAAYSATRVMTLDEAAALEKVLVQNPEDAATRRKLLDFYRWTGKNPQSWDDNVAARRRHLLWLIEHHPDSDVLPNVRLTQREDPEGYAQARKLWLAKTAPAKTYTRALSNAAYFFGYSEKPIAEQMLLRAQAIEPDGPQPRSQSGNYYPAWSERLGWLYASAITGRSQDSTAGIELSHERWGRERLDASTDGRVILAGGERLRLAHNDEHREYGEKLIERVSQMQGPVGEEARNFQRNRAAANTFRTAFGPVPPSEWPAILAKSTGLSRLQQLVALAEHRYLVGESFDWSVRQPVTNPQASKSVEQDKRQASEAFARSKTYAGEAIDLAPTLARDVDVASALLRAHLAYGLNVLREGNREEAVKHLLAASAVQGADPFIQSPLEYRLVNYLLKNGERATVIDYLERSAPGRRPSVQRRMFNDAADIRAGRMPENYQRLLASGHL